MVKTDDYMDNELATASSKFNDPQNLIEDINIKKNENWLNTPPRSKSACLVAEYESDENQQKISIIENENNNNNNDDRRIRRQIANCNERRRMQSINAGFQSLRQLLPCKDGDKMSKASILAATAEFIQNLLLERDKLLEENAESAAKRRRLNFGEQNGAPTLDECIKTIEELRILLQNETHLRMKYEKELFDFRLKSTSLDQNEKIIIPSPSTQVNNLFCHQHQHSVINNNNNTHTVMGNCNQNDTVRMTSLLTSPLFSTIVSSTTSPSGSNNNNNNAVAVVAQQALINAASAVAAVTARNHQQINNNQFQQSNKLIFEQKQQEMFSINNKNENHHLNNSNSSNGLNTSLSISQRNLQSLVLAIRHLEGAK